MEQLSLPIFDGDGLSQSFVTLDFIDEDRVGFRLDVLLQD